MPKGCTANIVLAWLWQAVQINELLSGHQTAKEFAQDKDGCSFFSPRIRKACMLIRRVCGVIAEPLTALSGISVGIRFSISLRCLHP